MPRERKAFNRKEIARFAEWLRDLGAEATGFAGALEQEKFDGELWVDAGDAMQAGLKHVAKWLYKLKEAHRVANIPGMDSPAAAPSRPRHDKPEKAQN